MTPLQKTDWTWPSVSELWAIRFLLCNGNAIDTLANVPESIAAGSPETTSRYGASIEVTELCGILGLNQSQGEMRRRMG